MKNANLQEVEVKLYTPDLSVVQQSLEKAGAKLAKARILERNIRYMDSAGKFAKQGVVLRMRQDSVARLTYKSGKTIDEGISKRFEAEVTVSDFDTMDTILRLLRFEPYMVYEKYRTTYTLENAEIDVDEMPYGNFTEIEGDVSTIEALITQLEFSHYPRMSASYTDIFEYVKHHMELDFDDLTFENFEGLDVPASALKSPASS